jgi:hypothetical protein
MAGLWGSLRTGYHTLVPLAIAALLVIPKLPIAALGDVASTMTGWLRQVSVIQKWNMYAPDPQTAHTYLVTYAEFADGRRERLVEAQRADAGWSTIWGWQKTRVDMWSFYATLNPDKVNRNRTWYLRAVCVRESLARGEVPRKVVSERVRRRFTHPDQVRAGQPGLGPLERYPLQSVECSSWPIRDMIAQARERQQQAS